MPIIKNVDPVNYNIKSYRFPIRFKMMYHQNSFRFCLICYKSTNELPIDTTTTLENLQQFVKIVTILVGRHKVYPIFELVDDTKLFECCTSCNKIIESFCESNNQINNFDMKFVLFFEELVEKIKYGDKISTRLKNVSRVLVETFRNDFDKIVKSQYRISKFRQSMVEIGNHRKLRSNRGVLISQSENLQSTKPKETHEAKQFNHSDIICEDDKACKFTEDMPRISNDYIEHAEIPGLGNYSNQIDEDSFANLDRNDESASTNNSVTTEPIANFEEENPFVGIETVHRTVNQILESTDRNILTPDITPLVENVPLENVGRMEQSTDPKSDQIQSSQRIQCPKCGKHLLSAYSLQVHMECHNERPLNSKWCCETCQKTFETRAMLLKHVKLNLICKINAEKRKLARETNRKEISNKKIRQVSSNQVKVFNKEKVQKPENIPMPLPNLLEKDTGIVEQPLEVQSNRYQDQMSDELPKTCNRLLVHSEYHDNPEKCKSSSETCQNQIATNFATLPTHLKKNNCHGEHEKSKQMSEETVSTAKFDTFPNQVQFLNKEKLQEGRSSLSETLTAGRSTEKEVNNDGNVEFKDQECSSSKLSSNGLKTTQPGKVHLNVPKLNLRKRCVHNSKTTTTKPSKIIKSHKNLSYSEFEYYTYGKKNTQEVT